MKKPFTGKIMCVIIITLFSINLAVSQYSFTPDTTQGCPPLTVTFTNTTTDTNAYYYDWDFGDGDYKNDTLTTTISHTYTSSDTYWIYMNVYDTLWNYIGYADLNIQVLGASGNFNISADTVCPGDNISFSSGDEASSYSWDFGDGNTATGQWVSNTYNSTGTYAVTLVINTVCGIDTIIDSVTVDTTIIPNAGFGFWNDPACPNEQISFQPWNQGASYLWDFGDSYTSSSGYPYHSYDSTGIYAVSLTLTNGCGNSDTKTDTVTITNNIPISPGVSLNIDPNLSCPGEEVNFNAPGGFYAYVLDFGDGSPVDSTTDSYYSHIYAGTGTFPVALKIYNSCGNDTILYDTVIISNNIAFPDNPGYSLNVNPSNACPLENIDFYAPWGFPAYVWDFGDGSQVDSTTSYRNDHSYADTGLYNVSVTIYNYCGNDSTFYNTVLIDTSVGFPGSITLDIYSTPSCPGKQISVQVSKKYPVNIWDYGDSSMVDTTSSGYVYHTYPDTGSYNASVTLINLCGNDTTLNYVIDITDDIQLPGNLQLSINPDTACPGDDISLYASGGYFSYVWDFGDDSPADSVSGNYPYHTYNDTGIYTISVEITNYCGFDTIISNTVVVRNDVGFPNSIELDKWPDNSICPGDDASFSTDYGYASYYWDFGDGSTAYGSSWADHTYDSIGIYMVNVTIINNCGIDTILSNTVTVDTMGVFPGYLYINVNPDLPCPGDLIMFNTSSGFVTYIWNFGDGDTIVTTSRNVNHSYDSAGTYTVQLTLFNNCGDDTTIYETLVIDDNAPMDISDIYIPVNPACPGDEVFLSTEDDWQSSYIYSWDYGDGFADTTMGTGSSHIYIDTGNYAVTLTVTNSCGNSATSNSVIQIQDSVIPVIGEMFGVAGGSGVAGCPGDAILFFFYGAGTNVWDFGDSTYGTATEQVMTEMGIPVTIIKHAYDTAGTYLVKLTLFNSCGNSTSDSLYVTIDTNLLISGEIYIEPPIGNSGYNTCTDITFLGFGGSTYDWGFGDGTYLTTISPNVSHSYSTPGNYPVSVTITNGCGSSATFTDVVDVNSIGGPALTFTSTIDPTCYGGSDGSAAISASSGDAPYIYIWDDPLEQTTDTANNLGAGTYNVTVTDANGCSSTSAITINNPVPISLTLTTVASTCETADGSASVVASNGSNPYTYQWSNGSTNPIITNLLAGTYSLTVTDANGCAVSDTIIINDNNGPEISYSANNVSCDGGTDGSVDITVSGNPPFIYSWSNGDTIDDISNLSAGSYIISVTDSNNCNGFEIITVNEPGPISLSSNTVDANCGEMDGSATVIASGGTSPYTYQWDANAGSQTTATATALSANAYNVTVTDANNCTSSITVMVNNANAPVISVNNSDISCYGAGDGSIDIAVTGGTTPYMYIWSNGSFSQDIFNLDPGYFSVIIQDGSGCWTGVGATINEPDSLIISTSTVDAHCGYLEGSAFASVNGGTTPYNYLWSSGGTSATETGLDTGTYTLTVTDTNGCTAVDNITISIITDPQPICIVTVDTTSTKNIVVWSKPVIAMGIDSFRVYREIAGLGYVHIGSVAYDSLSEFIDTTNGINPQTTSYRYKLATVDSCGNISVLSDYHETIHLTPPTETGGDITLIWDNYEGFGFNYYRILRDSLGTGNFEAIDSVTNSNFTYTNINAPIGILNYNIEVVHSTGCTSTLKTKDYNSSKSNTTSISTGALPVPDFTADTTSIVAGGSVNFTDFSTNNPISWSWTFTGGTPSSSTVQDPTNIVYNDTGCYEVKLVATNTFGTDSITKTCYINVTSSGGAAPVADFIASNTSITVGGSIDFLDQSQNTPTSWTWYFDSGNPSFSLNQNPANITYNTQGSFDVTLVVTNPYGTDTLTKTNYISVTSTGSAPVANFTANPTSIVAGGSVNFTDISTNSPTFWSWAFTGGTPSSSTVQYPTNIVYNDTGCYDVTLVATNTFGTDSITKTCYINVTSTGSAPVANFTANPTSIVAGGSVNFTDFSTNNPTSWSWTFTGGTPSSSTMQNPTNIVYADTGCYDVTLIATNAYGSDSLTKTCYILVTPSGGAAPVAGFIASDTSITFGGSIDFLDQSQNTPTLWTWLFEGGNPSFSIIQNPVNITYNTQGPFNVTLVVTNPNGTDTLIKTNYINVNPVGISEVQVAGLKFKVYPNPNKGIFNLEIYPEEKEDIKIEIFDMQGQLIYSEPTGRISGLFNKEIDLSGYSKGIYHLQVITKRGVINKKIIIE
ncbi:MAG: PKD domain-containing protein [Bacteroidota bacterium]